MFWTYGTSCIIGSNQLREVQKALQVSEIKEFIFLK
jgi:hypothetical protein